MNLIKAHAFGNDFLLVDGGDLPERPDHPAIARMVCDRHRGIGADGLLLFSLEEDRASMRLWNADGSPSEISGNGLRCLAAWIAHSGGGPEILVDTDAGRKRLELLEQSGVRYTFRAAMGHPEHVRHERLAIDDRVIEVVTLRVGNPQCVVLGEVSHARLQALGSALAVHPHFPEGTNVELAAVVPPSDVRILIWERGVGPTEASGTGACAAAVAAMTYGGAAREVQVHAPGGTQRVEWDEDGLFLTGWAEIIATIRWVGPVPAI
jgi:diaminopimelate epimerase